jgi:peptidoglycan/LPS O-acetylase OafA/YrhL
MNYPRAVRIPSIDGLRGIAVVLVMAYHFDIGLPGGFIGVDVFFAISGFVVARRLLDQFTSDRAAQPFRLLKDFYIGRFWRLFPALALMVAAVVVVSQFMNPVLGNPRRNVAHGFATLLGLSNWFRLLRPDLPGEMARPLLHAWSLSIEEQFYVCLPLLLAIFHRRARTAAFVIGGLCVAVSALPLPSNDPSERYFFTLARLAPLGFGVILAAFFHQSDESARTVDSASGGSLVGSSTQRRSPKAIDAVFVVVGVLLIPTLRRSNWNDASLFPLGLFLIGLLSAGVLGLLTMDRSAFSEDSQEKSSLRRSPGQNSQRSRGVHSSGLVTATLESKLAQYVGTRSYSLYLWHFPIAHLFMSQPRPLRTAAWVVLSFFAAELSYRCIECPLRYRKARRPEIGLATTVGPSA